MFIRVYFCGSSRGEGGGGMMFDSLALHAGIYRAVVYKMVVEDISLWLTKTNKVLDFLTLLIPRVVE